MHANLLSALFFVSLPALLVAQTGAARQMNSKSENPEAVHRSALVIDTHADTPQRFLDEHFDLGDSLKGGDFNLETARKGNLGAEFFAIWSTPTNSRASTRAGRWN